MFHQRIFKFIFIILRNYRPMFVYLERRHLNIFIYIQYIKL